MPIRSRSSVTTLPRAPGRTCGGVNRAAEGLPGPPGLTSPLGWNPRPGPAGPDPRARFGGGGPALSGRRGPESAASAEGRATRLPSPGLPVPLASSAPRHPKSPVRRASAGLSASAPAPPRTRAARGPPPEEEAGEDSAESDPYPPSPSSPPLPSAAMARGLRAEAPALQPAAPFSWGARPRALPSRVFDFCLTVPVLYIWIRGGGGGGGGFGSGPRPEPLMRRGPSLAPF